MTRATVLKTLPGAPWLILAMGALAGGCYDYQEVEKFLLEPHQRAAAVEYRILPPDVLLIVSQQIPEIDGVRQTVRPDGKINLPLIGEVDVCEKTPKQVEQEINRIARKFYGEVDATVQVAGYNSQKYYVFGQVKRPGPVPWTGHDTLLDALALAQPNFLAAPSRIIVVRGSTPQVGGQQGRKWSFRYRRSGVHPSPEDNPPKKMTINLWAMIKTGDMTNNILLMPNDTIYVRPHGLAAVGLAIQSLLLPIRPATETIQTPVAAAASVGM